MYVFGFLSFSYPQKLVFHLFFPFCRFSFLSFFRFFVRSDERGQGYISRKTVVAAAAQPTAIIQQHHINSSRKRARACFCEFGKFATQVLLFSVQVMALLGSADREVNMTAREVLFLERATKY